MLESLAVNFQNQHKIQYLNGDVMKEYKGCSREFRNFTSSFKKEMENNIEAIRKLLDDGDEKEPERTD